MKRYLGLNEHEMQENEEMWLEEQGESKTDQTDVGLRSVGITPGAISNDLSTADALPSGSEAGGAPGAEGVTDATTPAPALTPAPAGDAPAGTPAGPTGAV